MSARPILDIGHESCGHGVRERIGDAVGESLVVEDLDGRVAAVGGLSGPSDSPRTPSRTSCSGRTVTDSRPQ